ncbi:MAG: transposase [Rickettsiaceae bacterium]|nr:transposase [Rickettsiaceae bacterium]
MCRILNVCLSGYYEWTYNSGSKRAQQDKKLITMIRTICKEGLNTYGTRPIKAILERQGIVISRRHTTTLMKEDNLVCKTKRKFRATTDSNHKLPVAFNLLAR